MNAIIKRVPVWDRKTNASMLIDVELEIDTYQVARNLAQRAFDNKSHKANALRNAVSVTVRRVP